ncbi:Glutaminase A [Penicillium hispanicum]|uniref:Glutaminase A n=1 Tax=Penicillium hispanicum TaxID=1080232 RepID=UPI00253FEC59|nr:Glutaminase A [Penicillium hispanicum]KAJ5594326.1 Glutaminase A [Penicillium hispanicum]
MQLYRLGLVVASLAASVGAASTFTPARPPSLPLAVKSPYLSTWQDAGSDGGNGGYLAGQWPTFWQNQVTGWCGLIRVDGKAYTWMGLPGSTTVNQTAFEYTSSKSIFTMNVGGLVEMNITFLSPITPDDFKRQSLVFTYLDVEVSSLDGGEHDVQVYADISAEWVSGDRNAIAQWDYGTSEGIAYHKVYRQTQLAFSEINQQAEWGYWYWSTDDSSSVTYQSGEDTVVRSQFSSNGTLANTADTNYRAISSDWPVFGFASNLGKVSSSPVSTLFSLGLTQDEAVQYEGSGSYSPVQSLWKSYFDTDLAAVTFFHKDYSESSSLSSSFDSKVSSDASALGGDNYVTLTSLSARQVFGATQLCGTEKTTYLFLKEISSDGNMNTVDVTFPAYPFFLYANPEYLKLVLDPLYDNQESGKYPNTYAMHDIGSSYPNATGHNDGKDEEMPLEECGNMIIMTLAYAQKANNVDYLTQRYNLLKQWTGYLVEEALYPANQISTDDFAGSLANQTNLALKGMVGIQAMAVIANQTGHTADAANYSSIAKDYIAKWQVLAINNDTNPPHTMLNYNNASSHGLLYNLYADAQLGLNLVPQSVYDIQSAFYPTVENKYGVPLDTRHAYTKSDWQSFSAAIASVQTRDMFFKDIATWINETPTNQPLTDLYDTVSGDYPVNTFIARPVIGGSFAPLLVTG